jgi:histidinol-phosphatase
MTENTSTLLNAVEELTRRTGGVALDYFRRRVDVETKADGSPVTIADRSAERIAREWLAERFPGDAIVGEEYPATNAGASGRTWLIDPIDGTKTFVRGVPLWGTLVAVSEAETVLAGAAFFPALDDMLVAGADEGCWHNGVRARVSAVSRMEAATVLTTDERFTTTPRRRAGWERLAAAAAIARSWGDCYGYFLVATGRAEGMIDAIAAKWDTAAVQRCVVEAGGVFTDFDGAATAFGGSAIATNAALAIEARELLG